MTPLIAAVLITQTVKPTDSAWSTTDHAIQIHGHKLEYKATAGFLDMDDSKGETQAKIFFTGYTTGTPGRPITFVWNGGPGGSSLLTHMYGFGPRMLTPDPQDAKKFVLTDNQDTILADTDLVFVDPVGTGYSKAVKADPKNYWGVQGDTKATDEFIRAYLEKVGRKSSPVFLAGESYGTYRAAAVAWPLLSAGVNLRGLVLISNAIRFDTFIETPDLDLSYTLFLPTLTATAAYYHKLKPEWNQHPDQAIAEAKSFASGQYLLALGKGDSVTSEELQSAAAKLSELTSLPTDYILKRKLRLNADDFRFQLLKAEGKRIGKFSGIDPESYEPASPEAVSTFVKYVQQELGFNTDDKYLAINMGANMAWKWNSPLTGFPDTSATLKAAMETHPDLRLFVVEGMYDMTCPFYGQEYQFTHLGLKDEVKSHWSSHAYKAGHMVYLVPSEHDQLKADVTGFIHSCLSLPKAQQNP